MYILSCFYRKLSQMMDTMNKSSMMGNEEKERESFSQSLSTTSTRPQTLTIVS